MICENFKRCDRTAQNIRAVWLDPSLYVKGVHTFPPVLLKFTRINGVNFACLFQGFAQADVKRRKLLITDGELNRYERRKGRCCRTIRLADPV
jgi:hypothetical protein